MSGHRLAFDLYNAQNKAIPDPGSAGIIRVNQDLGHVALVSAAAESRTLPAPGQPNLRFLAYMKTDGGDITLTVTGGYDESGSTTMVFNDTGDFANFISIEEGAGTFVWRLSGYDGVTGPTLTFGSILAGGSIRSNSASSGIGYATGAGGAVTQITNRTTGVTVNAICGAITTDTSSLAAGAEAEFTVTNSSVAVGDVVVVALRSGATANTSVPVVTTVAAGSFKIQLTNLHASTADTGASIINFAVIKAVGA